MTTVTGSLALEQLTETELLEGLRAGAVHPDEFAADIARREQAQRRSVSARAAARARDAEWEAAAYAQYQAACEYCAGDKNMLSEAGKRAGRDAWPMCWEGAEDTARLLASDELITFWDYVSPRVPGPAAYATAKREAAAEHKARAEDATPAPSAPRMPPVPDYRPRPSVPVPDYSPATAPRPPGPMAGYIRALGAVERQALRTARAVERVNGGIQR